MARRKKKEDEKFKKIEDILREYKSYKAGIKVLQQQLDYIMPNMTASYEVLEGSVGTFTIKSKTEDYAIDRLEGKRALQLHEDIAMYKIIVRSIDDAIMGLEEHEREFVQYRYFNKWSMEKTASKMGYTERNLYFVRKRVKAKFLISLKHLIELHV